MLSSKSIFLLCILFFVPNESLNITAVYELADKVLISELATFIENKGGFNTAEQCISDIQFWKQNFFSFEPWALSMFDAGGKFPSGLLNGNLMSLGQFEQCLRVKYEDPDRNLEGKYCLARVPLSQASTLNEFNLPLNYVFKQPYFNHRSTEVDALNNIAINWAICIPDSCKSSEIQDLINQFWSSIGINSDSPFITVSEHMCSTNEKPKWLPIDWVALAFFVAFALTIAISTSYDLYICFIRKDRPRHHNIFASFSLYTNTARLITVSNNPSSLGCLHGIRVMSMFWVILGHRYGIYTSFPMINRLMALQWTQTYASLMILTANFAVDTFFVMSGFLLAYVFFKQYEKKKSFNVVMFYFHRFLRLTPALLAIVIFHGTLLKYIGSGPLWNSVYGFLVKPCEEIWWLTLLYIQNYITKSEPETCVGQTWYISVDMQLYVLSPILIYPLIKNRKIGIMNMIFWIIVAQITVISIAYVNDWSGLPTTLTSDQYDYFHQYYYVTHTRANSWILGFAAGYVVYQTAKREIKLNKFLVILLWILSLGIMASVIFGAKSMQSFDHVINKLEDGSYSAFARTGWSVALIWIIFACVHGYGGPINWFLSWKCWEILGRLSYSMYLIHIATLFWFTFSSRVVTDFSHFAIFYVYFGDLVVTIFFAYWWAMAFESPFTVLEKAIFHKTESSKESNKDVPKSDPIVEPTIIKETVSDKI